MRIINVVGARPNFMKIAPLMEEYERHPEIEPLLVHTGQHYDEKMSTLFFKQLGLRAGSPVLSARRRVGGRGCDRGEDQRSENKTVRSR